MTTPHLIPIRAIVAGGCVLIAPSITLVAAILGSILTLVLAVLALLAVLSNQEHRRQAAFDVLTQLIAIFQSAPRDTDPPRHRQNHAEHTRGGQHGVTKHQSQMPRRGPTSVDTRPTKHGSESPKLGAKTKVSRGRHNPANDR